MTSVKIVEVTRVYVLGTATPPPEPLLRLSALDAQWLTLPLIQRVLLFDGSGGGSGSLPPFSSAVDSLRASLAATLARFLPLAAKIVFLPSTGDAAIDCSEVGQAGGVRFIVAESDADAKRLAADEDHDVEAFARLVPVLDAGELPAETLAVQATRLAGGGLAVGVALHHAVSDGRSVWRFLEAWAATCRGDMNAVEQAPTFDRAAIALPGGEELARSTLRKYTPNLPVATEAEFLVDPNLSRRTFTVTAEQMRHLKKRIASTMTWPPSAFVAIAALAWVSFVRSKHLDAISADDDVYLFFFIDGRGRAGIDPPVADHYFGTCISGCLVAATARDLLAEDGVTVAATAVQDEVRRATEDLLAGWDWMDVVLRIPLDRMVNMSGSTRFQAYEATELRVGPAQQDGAGHHEPRWASDARRGQGRGRWLAGVRVSAPGSRGRLQILLPHVLGLIPATRMERMHPLWSVALSN